MCNRKYHIVFILCLFLVCDMAIAQVDTAVTGNSVLDSAMVVASSRKFESLGNIYTYTVEKSASIVSVAGEPDVVR